MKRVPDAAVGRALEWAWRRRRGETPSTVTPAALVIEEIRRQVDFQISTSGAIDTKATALVGAIFVLVAAVVPRVRIDTIEQVVATAGTFELAIATMVLLAAAIRGRIGGYSYGPRTDQMLEYLDRDVDDFNRELAKSFVKVRNVNEAANQGKTKALNGAIYMLIATTIGLGIMLAVGAIERVQ